MWPKSHHQRSSRKWIRAWRSWSSRVLGRSVRSPRCPTGRCCARRWPGTWEQSSRQGWRSRAFLVPKKKWVDLSRIPLYHLHRFILHHVKSSILIIIISFFETQCLNAFLDWFWCMKQIHSLLPKCLECFCLISPFASLHQDTTIEWHHHAPTEQITRGANVDVGKSEEAQTWGGKK